MVFLFKELLLSLNKRSLLLSLQACGATFLFLTILSLVFLSQDKLIGSEQVIALLKAEIPGSAINELYLQIREWEAVIDIKYKTKEEAEAKKLPGKTPLAPYFEITLRSAAEVDDIASKLKNLPGITEIITYKQGALREVFLSTPAARAGILALLAILFLSAVSAIYLAIKTLIKDWEGEIELLKLSGVSAKAYHFPFFLMGIIYGLLGALGVFLLFYLFHLWAAANVELAHRLLPAILSSKTVTSLALRALLCGILLGLLVSVSAISIRLRREIC